VKSAIKSAGKVTEELIQSAEDNETIKKSLKE
jgi:hypothetical protein